MEGVYAGLSHPLRTPRRIDTDIISPHALSALHAIGKIGSKAYEHAHARYFAIAQIRQRFRMLRDMVRAGMYRVV